MGIVRNQSIKNSISFYIGMAIGAINTVIIYPNVFNDHPEHFGLIRILLAYAILVSTFTTFGIPKTFVRFFPVVKEKGQLYFLSLITPLLRHHLLTAPDPGSLDRKTRCNTSGGLSRPPHPPRWLIRERSTIMNVYVSLINLLYYKMKVLEVLSTGMLVVC